MSRLICGRKPVDELLINKYKIKKLYLLKENRDWDQKSKALNFEISRQEPKFFEANFPAMNHQNIAAEVDDYKYYELSDVLQNINIKENPTLVILDSLEDPGNFGAIIRTCVATGVKAIIIKKDNQVKVNSTVIKTSSGYAEKMKIVMVTNLTSTINELKKVGFWTVATAGNAKLTYKNMDYKMPLALIIGNESKGISKLVLENSDFKISLPMENEVDSLNASVSAGIILYEIYGQKRGK